jgi:hypothetical protein
MSTRIREIELQDRRFFKGEPILIGTNNKFFKGKITELGINDTTETKESLIETNTKKKRVRRTNEQIRLDKSKSK